MIVRFTAAIGGDVWVNIDHVYMMTSEPHCVVGDKQAEGARLHFSSIGTGVSVAQSPEEVCQAIGMARKEGTQ
jgi:hypothetical protein